MSLFAASLLAVSLMTAVPSDSPIRLKVEPSGNGLALTVLGQSPTAVSASYRLNVTAGSNRSQQSGEVALEAGQEVTLVQLNLGGEARADWNAELDVTLADGRRYTDRRGGR